MSHLRFSASERDSLHAEPCHRTRGFDLGGIVSDIGGVFKGVGEAAVDTVTGIAEAVTNPVDTATGIASLVTDPKESWPALWHGLTNPIVEDWKNGNEGEAIGRGIFGVLEVIVGSKGVSKIGKVVKRAPDAPDAPKVPKPDADAPKPDAPKVDPKRRAVIDRLELSPKNARFAERVDVDHIFNGGTTKSGATNGGHVAPDGPGRRGSLTIREIDNPDKPYRPGETWRAKVQHDDATKGKTSTMYPREWSNDDVVTAIREADKNATFDEVRASASSDASIRWGVGTHRGIEINIQKNVETGEIVTAYPRTSGTAFTP